MNSVAYVPLLAEQGTKFNVGGDHELGGLLAQDPTSPENLNVLQLLVGLVNKKIQ